MKHCLALVSMSMSLAAIAEPAMVSDRGDKGKVVLTAERHEGCPGEQRIAYLTRRIDPDVPNDRITYWGCWRIASADVKIHYFVGADRSYRRADFSFADVERSQIPKREVPDGQGAPTL